MTARLVFAALWLLIAAVVGALIPLMWQRYHQGLVRARVAYVWTGMCVTAAAVMVALAAGVTGGCVVVAGLVVLAGGAALVVADLRRGDLP